VIKASVTAEVVATIELPRLVPMTPVSAAPAVVKILGVTVHPVAEVIEAVKVTT